MHRCGRRETITHRREDEGSTVTTVGRSIDRHSINKGRGRVKPVRGGHYSHQSVLYHRGLSHGRMVPGLPLPDPSECDALSLRVSHVSWLLPLGLLVENKPLCHFFSFFFPAEESAQNVAEQDLIPYNSAYQWSREADTVKGCSLGKVFCRPAIIEYNNGYIRNTSVNHNHDKCCNEGDIWPLLYNEYVVNMKIYVLIQLGVTLLL